METLLEGGCYFEGPRWHDGRWWVSDFYQEAVYAVDPSGTAEEVLRVENQPSGIGWRPDGSMLIVSMKDHRLLHRAPDGAVTVFADLDAHCVGNMNDMVVDDRGRAYIGDIGFDLLAGDTIKPTSLKFVDADGSVSIAAEDLLLPNGLVITPDGGTLIVGESLRCRYTAFTIGADGSLSDRRVWAQIEPTPSGDTFEEILTQVGTVPDGCGLDAENHLWVADPIGRRCLRVKEGGEVVQTIPAPNGQTIFACMLGGEDGRTLLLCAAPDFLEEARSTRREAVLFTTRVDVPHAGRP